MSDAPFSDKPTGGSSDERMWGMLCHLSTFAGYLVPFGNILGPLIIWLVKKDEYAFVDDQGKEALNFQISITIYSLVSGILILALIGIPLLIAVIIFSVVMTVIAAIKANGGEYYRYPLTIRLVK
jgi:hypothetical protein